MTMRAAMVGGVLLMAAAAGATAAETCPLDQPVIRDIRADRFYVDDASSIVDPAIEAANKAALVPLDATISTIQKRSNRFLQKGTVAEAACALALLARQAEGGAMLGAMSSRQAGYERKWRTAGLAMVYLALKDRADAAERAAIEPWLARLADQVEAMDTKPASWNNHHYWIGYVSTAVGVATGDTARLARGRQAFDDGLAAIGPDGTLPRELGRRGRALSYHNYALAPLVMAAEIAAHAGEDWYARHDGALHRLAARVSAGLADPAWFEARTGVKQEIPGGGVLAWSWLYDHRFPGRFALPTGFERKPSYMSFGGDMKALAGVW